MCANICEKKYEEIISTGLSIRNITIWNYINISLFWNIIENVAPLHLLGSHKKWNDLIFFGFLTSVSGNKSYAIA